MRGSSIDYTFEDHKILDTQIEKVLFKQYQNETSDEKKLKIRDYIASHNIRFLVKTAYTYRKKFSKVPVKDLIGYGMLGLFRAIDKFDPEREEKFITYCVWWIKQSIVSSVQDLESPVRYPLHIHQRIQKKIKEKDKAFEDYDDEIKGALNTMLGGVSMNQAVYSDSDITLADIIRDESNSPDESVTNNYLMDYLDVALNKLSPEEKRVIESCFGINRVRQNMEDIGTDLGKSRETIRLSKKKAMKKLRKSPIMKNFYMEYCA